MEGNLTCNCKNHCIKSCLIVSSLLNRNIHFNQILYRASVQGHIRNDHTDPVDLFTQQLLIDRHSCFGENPEERAYVSFVQFFF